MSMRSDTLDDRFGKVFFDYRGAQRSGGGGSLQLPDGSTIKWTAGHDTPLEAGVTEPQPVIWAKWEKPGTAPRDITVRSLSVYTRDASTGELIKILPKPDPSAVSQVYHPGLGVVVIDAARSSQRPRTERPTVRDRAIFELFNNPGRDGATFVGQIAVGASLWDLHAEANAMRRVVEAIIAQALGEPVDLQNP